MHTHARRMVAGIGLLLAGSLFVFPTTPAESMGATFAPGDLFVSVTVLAPLDIVGNVAAGQVQWRSSDGTLNRVLNSEVPGTAEGMGFDAARNLYLTHWCVDQTCVLGNTVERFDSSGVSQGAVGSGYDCNPHAIVFDAAGNAYVGQADCTGAILKFEPGNGTPVAFAVAPENRGSFWIDLAADGCTVMYTSWGPNVKRFNVCTGVQRPNFNVAPLPGGEGQDLRVLPDGGVLVSSGQVIARLNASGALVQTYGVTTGEPTLWGGLELVGDGTFWAGNFYSSNVYRFDLATGAVRASFNTGTPPQTVIGIRVLK